MRTRLLALRIADAPFDGEFRLRSRIYEHYLEARGQLQAGLGAAQAALVETLYDLVPQLEDDELRSRAIQLKRDIYNGRSVEERTGSFLSGAGAEQFATYVALQHKRNALDADAAAEVPRGVRDQLKCLTQDPAFRRAVAYLSASLDQKLRDYSAATSGPFTKVEKSLYEVASRFATKANPFFTFAQVSFPPSSSVLVQKEAELVLSLPCAHELERQLLTDSCTDAYIYAQDAVIGSAKVQIYVSTPVGLVKQLTLDANPVLVEILRLLRDRGPMREHALRTSLRGAFSSLSDDQGQRYLDTLVRNKILVRHLMCDPRRLVDDLCVTGAIPPEQEATLRAFHHAETTVDALPLRFDTAQIFGTGVADWFFASGQPQPPVFVNRYSTDWAGARHEETYGNAAQDLSALAPTLGLWPNTVSARSKLSAVLAAMGDREGSVRISFYDLITHIRTQGSQLDAEARTGPHTQSEALRQAHLARLAACTGTISHRKLATLTDGLPPAPPLCVNGPVDHQTGVFYLTNIWDGNGRYLSRYSVHRRSSEEPDAAIEDEPPAQAASSGPIDVCIYDPLRSNLNHTVCRYRTGFALTPRHRPLFSDWIYPSDVAITYDHGVIAYWHHSTGQQLRFYHGGLALSRELPLEYQVLLVNQADVYTNPFLSVPRVGDGVTFTPGVHYGVVCLRRDGWTFGSDHLPAFDGAPVRDAVRLRDWVLAHVTDSALFYYRLLSRRATTRKPRFLDLRSPLSVASFLRRIRKLRATDPIVLERMEPGPDGILLHHGRPHVCEVMIEIGAAAAFEPATSLTPAHALPEMNRKAEWAAAP